MITFGAGLQYEGSQGSKSHFDSIAMVADSSMNLVREQDEESSPKE